MTARRAVILLLAGFVAGYLLAPPIHHLERREVVRDGRTCTMIVDTGEIVECR